MSEYLNFKSIASDRSKDKIHIVIVGAGIIGCCTAYFLVTHPNYDPEKYHITIIESKRVAGGASGKAGGLLALWAFPQQIVPLSFNLHQELATKYNGEKEWGYRRLTTVSLEGDLTQVTEEDLENDFDDEEEDPEQEHNGEGEEGGEEVTNGEKKNGNSSSTPLSSSSSTSTSTTSSSSSDSKPAKKYTKRQDQSRSRRSTRSESKLPKDLNWINSSLIDSCSELGGTDTTAQVHPYKFTNFILKKAVELSKGSIELILGKVKEIEYSIESGSATGVKYEPTSIKDSDNVKDNIIELSGDQIVMTVGPWTSKILPDCPISGLRAHSITVAPFKDQPVSPYAIFTEFKKDSTSYISPEIYARQDEVYICGEGDSAVDVPETTDDVEVVTAKCDDLFDEVSKFSPNLRKGRILKRQACYLPVLEVPTSSGPLIGETNVNNLYLCSGHSCWGINNAPGSGKIMSELLLDGKAKSARISSLDPSLYFDASVLVEADD